MSSIPALNDGQWLKLLEHVAAAFNEVTLSRGFNYFKQQRVAALTISVNRVVQARVSDFEDYTVTLDLNQFDSSSCTCPLQTSCKHLAAVTMELADRLGYPAFQIVNAQHHLKRLRAISSSASRESRLLQLPDMDIRGWHEFLDAYTAQVKPTHPRLLSSTLRDELQLIHKSAVSFSAIDLLYFDLHQNLFILRKVKEQYVQGKDARISFSVLYPMYDEIHDELRQRSASFNYAVGGKRLEQTLSYIRQQMAEEANLEYLDYGLYIAFLKYGLASSLASTPDRNDWVLQEMNDIEQQTTDASSSSLTAAKAFLYLVQSRFSHAWETLAEIDTLNKAPTSLFLSFLQHIADCRDWVNLLDWLVKTAPYFYGHRNKELDAYIGYWKKAVAHDPQAERHLWKVLEAMLPHAFPIIEELLYELRKWKPWLEMQIVKGHDPLSHPIGVLQPIEQDSPNLLLPYYHQAIEHYITLKNRDDYKLAIKLLKKLKRLYHQTKRSEHWDRFFSGFMERHSRLRALQEEIKKGTLLE